MATPSPLPDRCPECGSSTQLTQGTVRCSNCGWQPVVRVKKFQSSQVFQPGETPPAPNIPGTVVEDIKPRPSVKGPVKASSSTRKKA